MSKVGDYAKQRRPGMADPSVRGGRPKEGRQGRLLVHELPGHPARPRRRGPRGAEHQDVAGGRRKRKLPQRYLACGHHRVQSPRSASQVHHCQGN